MNTNDDLPPSSPIVPIDAWGLETLMDTGQLAAYLGVTVATVYDWRVHGKGPAAYRFGKHLKFAVSDVRAWVAEQREPSGPPSGDKPRSTDRR